MSNFGARWNAEQEEWLLRAVGKGMCITDIAEKMSRTHGSIASRLQQIACISIENGGTMENACISTGLTEQCVKEGQKKRADKEAAAVAKKLQKLQLQLQQQQLQETLPVAVDVPVAVPLSTHVDLLDESKLNDEQRMVLTRVREGRNIFLTGGAGVGKSYTVKHIINYAHTTGRKIGVCGMTGSAAILIDGTTLHSYMGIGLAKESVDYLVRRIQRFPETCSKLRSLDMLLIDEVSMMNNDLFDKVSDILGIIRKRTKEPFGGVQMVLVGDMYQLQPIEGTYCFMAKGWAPASFDVFLLKTNMRQKDDEVFKNMLDRLRLGKCSKNDFKVLQGLSDTVFPEGVVPTRLYSRNADVEKINEEELAKICTNGTSVYDVKYKGDSEKRQRSKKWAESMKLSSTKICVGAQVVLTRNQSIEEGLVNGSRGVVTGIFTSGVTVKFVNGLHTKIEYYTLRVGPDGNTLMGGGSGEDGGGSVVELSYLPLKLAWAISIHASQGMTLDALEINLGDSVFACGQAYTGLSRARNMASVRIVDVVPTAFKTHISVAEFYKDVV